MDWPYRRFLKAYDAFQRRRICDEMRDRKIAHIMALNANSNFVDDDKSGFSRQTTLDDLERTYDELIARIWNGDKDESHEAEENAWKSPLMRAGHRAVQAIQMPSLPGESQVAALPTG